MISTYCISDTTLGKVDATMHVVVPVLRKVGSIGIVRGIPHSKNHFLIVCVNCHRRKVQYSKGAYNLRPTWMVGLGKISKRK